MKKQPLPKDNAFSLVKSHSLSLSWCWLKKFMGCPEVQNFLIYFPLALNF